MKNYTKIFIVAAAVAATSSSVLATQVRLTNPTTGYQGLDASGNTLSSHGAGIWTFQAGVFGDTFTPSAGNLDNWATNWQPYTPLTATWQTGGPNANKAQIQAAVDAPDLVGSTGFVWGYNTQTIDASAEWILLTNASWVFPAYDAFNASVLPENIWNYGSAGTSVVGMGSFVNGDPTQGLQTTQAIPEPSTYALIFGLGILGFLGFRRVRK